MGQGRWIRERDGHYKHYTEEEYKNSPHGIGERWANYIIGIIILFVAIMIVISIIVNIVQWFIGLF